MDLRSTSLTARHGTQAGPANADTIVDCRKSFSFFQPPSWYASWLMVRKLARRTRITSFNCRKPFSFFQLPAELREQIYLIALQPINAVDTASIPGTPDRVHIPPWTQVSRQLRDEALHVLYKHRPVEISLHSYENLRRAYLWVEKCYEDGRACGLIIFSGRLNQVENQFYHITLERLENPPYFRVQTRPGASLQADALIAQMKDELLKWLDQKVKNAKYGREASLSSKSIIDMIYLIDTASRQAPPESASVSTNSERGNRRGRMA